MVDRMMELIILSVLEIIAQISLIVEDMEIIKEYILVDPHMINEVPLSVRMDKYRALV